MSEGASFMFAFIVGVVAGGSVVLTFRWFLAWAAALEAGEGDPWAS